MNAKVVPYSVLLACAAIASGGCADVVLGGIGNQIKGSGRAAHESRTVSDFHKVRDDGAANVLIKVGSPISIRIEGDDNIVPLVKTRVENGELVIETKKNFHAKNRLLVTVTAPTLDAVHLDGAANVTVQNVRSDSFDVSLDGAGNVSVDGSVGTLSASLDGAGNLKLKGLRAKSASASVDGAGNVDVWASDSLTASINGVGNIRYKGSPSVQRAINGVGKIEKTD